MQIDNKLTRTNIFLQLCITRVYSKLTFFNRKTLQYYNESHGNTMCTCIKEQVLMIYDKYTLSVHHCRTIAFLTRCTRGDARSFFCTYKTYLYAQN